MRFARSPLALVLSGVVVLAAPSVATAATDVGATPPTGAGMPADCNANSGHFTRANTGANPYAATVSGVVTEWRFQADATGVPGQLALQIATPDATMNTFFTPVAESALESPVNGTLNRFKTRLPIAVGQVIGLRVGPGSGSHACYYLGTANLTEFQKMPAPLPGGGPADYGTASATAAVNVAATIEPDGDNDGFGDETQDGCPNNAARSDDCVAPSVKIDSGPQKKTKKAKAKFTFSSDDTTATFECSLDGKKFASCTSPLKVKVKKKKGKHTLEVRAVDGNGNTSDDAAYGWKVKPKKKKAK